MAKIERLLRVYIESPGDDVKGVVTFRKAKVSETVINKEEFDSLETDSEKFKLLLKTIMSRCEDVKDLYDSETGDPITKEDIRNLNTYADLLWALYDGYQEGLKSENNPYTQKKTQTQTESLSASDGSSSKTPALSVVPARDSGLTTE